MVLFSLLVRKSLNNEHFFQAREFSHQSTTFCESLKDKIRIQEIMEFRHILEEQ